MPEPIEPPRWHANPGKDHGADHGASDWQVTMTGHLVREKQVSGARLALDMDGFRGHAAGPLLPLACLPTQFAYISSIFYLFRGGREGLENNGTGAEYEFWEFRSGLMRRSETILRRVGGAMKPRQTFWSKPSHPDGQSHRILI